MQMDASPAAALESGDALLAFKERARNMRPPHEMTFRANAAILDDPSTRLAELDGFDELQDQQPDESEREAVLQALQVSTQIGRMSQLQPNEAALAPYLAAAEKILAAGLPTNAPVDEVELPVAIVPHLLLGDRSAAADGDALKAAGVTLVVNCADGTAKGPVDHLQKGMEYMQLNASDDLSYDILQHRAAVATHVRRHKDAGGKCLLHCHAGINRSGALVVAELMVSERMPLLAALRVTKEARGPLLWNRAFLVGLVRLASTEGLLGEISSE